MVYLEESSNNYIVKVNSYPFLRSELWNKEKGIVRIYGQDNNREKINEIRYPKKYYNREYITGNILPKYETCPLCNIGRKMNNNNKIATLGILAGIIFGGILFISILNLKRRNK